MAEHTASDMPAAGQPPPPRSTSTGVWGLTEAGVGWIAAQVIGSVALVLALAAGGWRLLTPARPGGYIGRAAAQLESGDPLEHDSIPLLVQLGSLVPTWIVLLGAAWLMAGVMHRERPGWQISIKPGDIPVGVAAGVLLQIPLIPILYLIVEWIFGEITPSARALTLVDQVDSPVEVIAMFALVAIGAPVVEELFYRGLVQRALVDRVGPVLGIGIAGLLFGAVHLSLIELPALTLVGLVLGWLYWRTGRLGPAIVAHITFNTFTLIVLLASG